MSGIPWSLSDLRRCIDCYDGGGGGQELAEIVARKTFGTGFPTAGVIARRER